MTHQNKKLPSLFFIGHIAIDTIIRFHKEHRPTLGGSVSFCSLSLKTYTKDVIISVISSIGKLNFDNNLLDIIKDKDIDLRGLKWTDTYNTNFILNYYDHSRSLTLKSKSPNLEIKDIPEVYLNNPPDIIVLAPLCNEISFDYISNLVNHFPNSYVAIDLQGFIRNIDNGNVSIIRDDNIVLNLKRIINLVDEKLFLKGSEHEMKVLSGKDDIYEVMNHFNNFESKGTYIMTLGEKGSLISKKGERILKIPAFQSRIVTDETGAGDVYYAIFLYEFIRSDKSWASIENAAYLGSSAASFNVEKTGPYGFETKERVLDRTNYKNYLR